MTIATNGHATPPSQPASAGPRAFTANELAVMTSVMFQRAQLAGLFGQQFDGKRDLLDTLGYPKALTFQHFLEKWQRQDIAARIVDLPAIDTWRKPPVFTDGDSEETPFLRDWKQLATRLPVWQRMMQVDQLAGIGRYGVLLIGLRDGGALADPPARIAGPEGVLYFRALHEGAADVGELVKDPQDERFGKPLTYRLDLGDGMEGTAVHWQRVIHVAENTTIDDVYGMPRLQRVYDRLEDLLKVVGGSAEATWRNMDRGLHADVRDGFSLSADDRADLADEIEDYLHKYQRFIRTQGVDLNTLGSDVVDPSGIFGVVIALIAAATNIPQRILIGSERGELASSQDTDTWGGVIDSRRENFAVPVIVRPTVDRLVELGALQGPQSGRFSVDWAPMVEADADKQSAVFARRAGILESWSRQPKAAEVVPERELRAEWLDLPADVPAEYQTQGATA